MQKIVLFAFDGEPICCAHVVLNTFDLKTRGSDARIVMEGSATRLVKELHEDQSLPFAKLYEKAVAAGLIDAVCDACSTKTGAKQSAVAQGPRLDGEMSGQPEIEFAKAGLKAIGK